MPRVFHTKNLWDVHRIAALKEFSDNTIRKKLGPRLDFLCATACELTGAETSLITLIDGDHEYRLAAHNLNGTRNRQPVKRSVCASVVDHQSPLVIDDLSEDPVFCDHVAVTELNLRSYLGYPLLGIFDLTLGSFCVFDKEPREWTFEDVETMRTLSVQATGLVLASSL